MKKLLLIAIMSICLKTNALSYIETEYDLFAITVEGEVIILTDPEVNNLLHEIYLDSICEAQKDMQALLG